MKYRIKTSLVFQVCPFPHVKCTRHVDYDNTDYGVVCRI